LRTQQSTTLADTALFTGITVAEWRGEQSEGETMRGKALSVRTYTAALAAVALLAIPASAQRTIAIDNFGQVSASYYRGAQPEGRDYQDLAALGVKTIINLTNDDRSADEKTMAKRAGMHYVEIPMTTHEAPTAEQLAEFMNVVNDPANQPVYVHCVGGRHRTGVMTAVYRMTHDGWTPDRAFAEMKKYRFGADFLHPEFKRFVYGYPAAAAPAAAVAAATKTGG
jgi:tyrosine-protein phosphatase SIW14